VTDLTHDGADEGFHEIQLSGKQLVFLFMATTVVSVVIFLCGVLVGRGVKGDAVNAAEPPTAQTSSATPAAAEPPPTTIDPPAGSSAGLSYSERLNTPKPVPEELKPAAPESRPAVETRAAEPPAKPATETPVPPPATKPAQAPAPTGTASAPAPQSGRPGIWAVQVVALSDRGAANSVVQRLNGKGYPAFVLLPAANAVQHYKVQVGRYTDRSEAEQIRARLKKEEQFEPIIVR
jgi:cell division septation protein DedD